MSVNHKPTRDVSIKLIQNCNKGNNVCVVVLARFFDFYLYLEFRCLIPLPHLLCWIFLVRLRLLPNQHLQNFPFFLLCLCDFCPNYLRQIHSSQNFSQGYLQDFLFERLPRFLFFLQYTKLIFFRTLANELIINLYFSHFPTNIEILLFFSLFSLML